MEREKIIQIITGMKFCPMYCLDKEASNTNV